MEKYFYFYLIFLLILLSVVCNDTSDRLVKPEEGWQFQRWTEELIVDGGVVYEQDSLNLGTILFERNEFFTWIDQDSTLRTFDWNYDEDANELYLANWRFEAPLGGTTIQQEGFSFKILEDTSQEQLWRATSERVVFNPFTQDSGQAIITIQWKLER